MPHDTPQTTAVAGKDPHVSAAVGAGSPGEGPGDSIGPYKLLELIGEGGFGVVYLAERREPMVQRVAIKVIKPGMDSKAVLARFEQERQALAVMDHPNVAKVFDAGMTTLGRPYFVMEHVAGEPITAYCDRQNLSLRERLELFIPVCEAVQHAHHKGIIHRDIKPSNILVGVHDEVPVPKVIDFGVAKAVSHSLTDKTIFTESGQMIGTPEYMSPEQAEMGRTDIDTRTDVYSLGAVMYELLTGSLPFDPKSLRSAGYAEIQRIIREVDPPKPSTRLSSLGPDASAAIARHRRVEAAQLSSELRRELEWIPLRALSKDRTERYDSPADMARDIDNYLQHRPLEAGPQSTAYRIRKLIRRNKGLVGAGGAVATALILGAAAFAWQAHIVRTERDTAIAARKSEQAARKAAEDASSQALAELQRFEAQTDFLRSLFRWDARSRKTATLVQALDRARSVLKESPRMDPALVIEVNLFLALASSELRQKENAQAHLATAKQIIGSGVKVDAPVKAKLDLINAYVALEYGSADDSLNAAREAVKSCENLPGANRKLLIDAQRLLAMVYVHAGDEQKAFDTMLLAFTTARHLFDPGATSKSVFTDLDQLATTVSEAWKLGHRAEAEQIVLKFAEPYVRAIGPDPMIPEGAAAIALYLDEKHESERAKPLFVLAASLSRKMLGASHPTTSDLNSLATHFVALDEDAPQVQASAGRYLAIYGAKSESEALEFVKAAATAWEERRYEDAITQFDKALEVFRSSDPCSPCSVWVVLSKLQCLTRLGRMDAFDRTLQEARALVDEATATGTAKGFYSAMVFAEQEAELVSRTAATMRLVGLRSALKNRMKEQTVLREDMLLLLAKSQVAVGDMAGAVETALDVPSAWSRPGQLGCKESTALLPRIAEELDRTGKGDAAATAWNAAIDVLALWAAEEVPKEYKVPKELLWSLPVQHAAFLLRHQIELGRAEEELRSAFNLLSDEWTNQKPGYLRSSYAQQLARIAMSVSSLCEQGKRKSEADEWRARAVELDPKASRTSAVAFESNTMDGKSIKFPDDFKGKIVLLDFWATWCGPCMQEVPNVVAAYTKFHDQGFEILGVSLDREDAEAKIQRITSEKHMSWSQVYDGKYWKARVAQLYSIDSIPAAFLVDGDTGKILAQPESLRGAGLEVAIDTAMARMKTKGKDAVDSKVAKPAD